MGPPKSKLEFKKEPAKETERLASERRKTKRAWYFSWSPSEMKRVIGWNTMMGRGGM